MPKHIVRCSAKCTYYCGEERHEIYCKGLSEGMRIHVAFASPAERKNWLEEHCMSIQKCMNCPVRKMLEENEQK